MSIISEVYNVDCVGYMKNLPDNFFDLSICDPPYGINADEKNSTDKKQSKKSAHNSKDYGNQKWDANIPSEEYFTQLKRVSKNQIIWGANYFGLTGGMIFWDKCVTMPTYSKGELAYCSLINSVQLFKYAWHGMIQQNMKDKELRYHPTQKPIALYYWLLQNYAKPNDRILDTHLGSGSSRIAAYELGFDFYGTEIDTQYFDDSCSRFATHIAQTKLFTPAQIKAEQTHLF